MGAAGGVSVVAGQPVTIEEQLSRGELVLVRTKGISMQPLLYEGQSHVIVAPAPADRALARLPDGRYLLHRVIGKDDAFYYTRGDNCCSQEAIPGSRWWGWRWKSPGGAGGFPWPGKYTVCIHGSGWPGTRCGGLREGSGWGWAAGCGGNAHEEKIYQ